MLLENGRHVALGHIVCKRAIAKHAGGFAGPRQSSMPFDDAQRERLGVVFGDGPGQARNQNATADRMNVFAGDLAFLDGHTAKLQQQLVENVCLGAVGLQMLDGGVKNGTYSFFASGSCGKPLDAGGASRPDRV